MSFGSHGFGGRTGPRFWLVVGAALALGAVLTAGAALEDAGSEGGSATVASGAGTTSIVEEGSAVVVAELAPLAPF
jgi:hypothetical protein